MHSSIKWPPQLTLENSRMVLTQSAGDMLLIKECRFFFFLSLTELKMILCAFVTNRDKDGSVQHMALFTVDGRPESSSTGYAAKAFEANHQEMWVRTNKV